MWQGNCPAKLCGQLRSGADPWRLDGQVLGRGMLCISWVCRPSLSMSAAYQVHVYRVQLLSGTAGCHDCVSGWWPMSHVHTHSVMEMAGASTSGSQATLFHADVTSVQQNWHGKHRIVLSHRDHEVCWIHGKVCAVHGEYDGRKVLCCQSASIGSIEVQHTTHRFAQILHIWNALHNTLRLKLKIDTFAACGGLLLS